MVNVTEVVAVEVADRPGGLAGLLELFEGSGINIEYMYAFTFGREDKAVLIFRFDQPDAAIERLRAAGINVVEASKSTTGSQDMSVAKTIDERLERAPPGSGACSKKESGCARSAARRTFSISRSAIRRWNRRRP